MSPTAHRTGTTVARGAREAWVDNLRVAAIAGVIVVHASTAYVADFADWYYDDELDATDVGSLAFALPALLGGIFGLGPLFLVAGWFAVRSLSRRGPGAFARNRLVRLGLPLVAFVLVVNPLADLVGSIRQEDRSFVSYLGETELSIMWFVAALLACSLGYAALRRVRPLPVRRVRPGPVTAVTAAAGIAASSVLLWPVTSLLDEQLMSLRPGAWTQAVALFTLGVLAGEAGWDGRLSRGAERRWGLVTAAGMLATVALVASAGSGDLNDAMHSMRWPGVAFAVLYGVVSVAFTLWCLSWVRRRWTGHGETLDRAGRASYATYVTHPLVLTAVMVGLGWLPAAAELKFVVVAAIGVPACFAFGYALTRLPGVRRVL